TVSGSATADVDYAALSGTVIIAVGTTSTNVVVEPLVDDLLECDETVILTLAADAAYSIGTPASATVTIADGNLPTVSLAATDPHASEAGQNIGLYTFTRNGCTSNSMTVGYTVSGSATAGNDYAAL